MAAKPIDTLQAVNVLHEQILHLIHSTSVGTMQSSRNAFSDRSHLNSKMLCPMSAVSVCFISIVKLHKIHTQLQMLHTFFLILFLFKIFFFLFFLLLLFLFLFVFPAYFPSLVVPLNVCRYGLHQRNHEYLKKNSSVVTYNYFPVHFIHCLNLITIHDLFYENIVF